MKKTSFQGSTSNSLIVNRDSPHPEKNCATNDDGTMIDVKLDYLEQDAGDEENEICFDETEDTSMASDRKDTPPLSIHRDNCQLSPALRLATSKRALDMSLWAIRFGVFADSVTSTILDPNYAFMALPNSHPDSFPSTEPFGVTAATYFLAMTALLGAAIGSAIIGRISDQVGRKPTILACLAIGAIGSIANYLARHAFWTFCATNFSQGLFAATIPIALAYVSDVKQTRREKDQEIGIIIGLYMIGTAGGGIAAILLEEQGLFAPLFVGTALNTTATVLATFFMIEPKKMDFLQAPGGGSIADDEEESSPKDLDKIVFSNIVFGALFDNIGSAGLVPLAMAPLALREFYINFLLIGEDPLMTQTAFKWLSVMVALTVIPGAAVSQHIFDRIGAPGGCILGNVITAVVIIALLFIATITPATNATYVGFICALYIGFPFTVLSQLSTGPMLDSIAPADRRGFVQGVNVGVMNFGTAVSPYILGEISDNFGISTAMWICVAISFAAALVNVPLVFVKELKPKSRLERLPKYARGLKWEDPHFVETVLKGEWVPAMQLELLNKERMEKGQPFLVIPYRAYEEDRKQLDIMKVQAKRDFVFLRDNLLDIMDSEEFKTHSERQGLLDQYYNSACTPEQEEELANGLGKWFADYLRDVGYWMDESPIIYKQMIMQAFPPITYEKKLTPDNMKEAAVNLIRVYNKYIFEDEENAIAPPTQAFAGRYVVP